MAASTIPIIAFDVPGRPISANARLGTNGRRRYLTREARDWKETVAWRAFLAGNGIAASQRLHPPLRIVCRVRGVRGDADNYAKLILDGMSEGMGIDDKHFRTVEMHATAKGVKSPGVRIEVYEMGDDSSEPERAA